MKVRREQGKPAETSKSRDQGKKRLKSTGVYWRAPWPRCVGLERQPDEIDGARACRPLVIFFNIVAVLVTHRRQLPEGRWERRLRPPRRPASASASHRRPLSSGAAAGRFGSASSLGNSG